MVDSSFPGDDQIRPLHRLFESEHFGYEVEPWHQSRLKEDDSSESKSPRRTGSGEMGGRFALCPGQRNEMSEALLVPFHRLGSDSFLWAINAGASVGPEEGVGDVTGDGDFGEIARERCLDRDDLEQLLR